MLIQQHVDSLLNGVSQLPPHQRDTSQAEEQVNGLSSLARGLRKRPPSQHVAKLTSDNTGYSTAFEHPIVRTATERYRVVVVNGDLKVFDHTTGVEQTVIFPNGKAYLAGSEFRAVTVGDTTYICNRGKVVAQLSTKAPDASLEAFLVVKAADFDTTYAVTIDSTTVNYTSSSSSKVAINTDVIASALRDLLASTGAFVTAGVVFTRFGSTIRVVRNDGKDFAVSVTDGLGGNALVAIKGRVQSFTDLPAYARQGAILEVVGSPDTTLDNYYVQYTDAQVLGQPGVWREIAKPGVLVSLDKTTMPHTLVRNGNILGPSASAGAPPAPLVGAGAGAEAIYGWQKNDLGGALDEGFDQTLHDHNAGVRTTPAGTDGTQRSITVTYDFSSPVVYSSATVAAVLRTNTGPATAFVERARSTYSAGAGGYNNQQLSYTGLIPAGADVELRLEYSGGVTPASAGDWGFLTAHSKTNTGGPGVRVQADTGTAITFVATQKYPAGCSVTATLDGTPFTYIVGAADETGAVVATGLHGLINPSAGFNSTNPSDGVVITKQAAGPAPVVTASVTFNEATTLHVPTATLIAGEHVGRVVKNLTDGSQGVITANTGTTVRVVSLTGGADNTFQAGDLCSIIGSGLYFVFSPATWTSRTAGDDTTCPFPSIVGQAIADVTFYANRLGLVAGENAVLSASGEALRLFRASAAQLLADDPIDVKGSLGLVTVFDSAVPWTDGLYLKFNGGIARLSGSPALTAETVRVDLMGTHPAVSTLRHLVANNSLLIASVKNGYTRIAEATLQTTPDGNSKLEFDDLTKHVPQYLVGSPIAFVCDPQAEIIAVVTDGAARRSLYVCVYHDVGDRRVQLSWSRWDFPRGSTLVAVDILDGIIGLVFKRADGAYLETVSLEPDAPLRILLADGTADGDGIYSAEGILS